MTYEETLAKVRIFRHSFRVDSKTKTVVEQGDPLQSTESAKRVYHELFVRLCNPRDWKAQTRQITVHSWTEATLVAEALTYFLGGAEVETTRFGGYRVGSRGHYHYMKHAS